MSLKRTIDIVGVLSGLIILSPIIAVTALTFRITMGSPILFWRAPRGLAGRSSTGSKFQTMTNVHDAIDQPLSNERRHALYGRVACATSLDRLPQPWNVQVGQMSFVGLPRLLTAYRDRYSAGPARRHDVKAGVTSWARINDATHFGGATDLMLKYGICARADWA